MSYALHPNRLGGCYISCNEYYSLRIASTNPAAPAPTAIAAKSGLVLFFEYRF